LISLYFRGFLRLFIRFFLRERVHSAFDTLFHHTASYFVRLVNVAVEVVIIRATTARTNELCKAIFAFFTGEQARIFKLFSDIRTRNSLVYVTHFKGGIARELVAGINIAVGGYREIFVTRSARRNALGKTGPAF
jgi:hypothetical protein